MAVQPARIWLLARGMSVSELARRIGRSRMYTSRALNGHEAPSRDFAEAVARELDVPVELAFFDLPNGKVLA